MIFKLVQIDSENPSKINLEAGTHIFGRDKFFNVINKRISRQHGQFEVTDDSLIITALHLNPCFYQKSGTSQVETLRQSSSVSLSSGDKLGLLPTSYWYEVLKCAPMDNNENNKTEEECQENTTREITAETGAETDNEEEPRFDTVSNANVVTENDHLESQSTEVLSADELDRGQNSNHMNLGEQTGDSPNESVIEKTVVDSTNFGSDTDTEETVSVSLLPIKQEIEETSNEIGPSSSDQSSAPQKRPHGVNEDEQTDEIKRVKTEGEEKPDVQSEPDSQGNGSTSNNNVNNSPPQLLLRERCMYGAGCYRRNIDHRKQYSHPQDDDWGTGEKAPCPWGRGCTKRDPRHWRDHDHPPGTQQLPNGIRVLAKKGNVFYVQAKTVNFYDEHFEAESDEGKKKKRDRSETPPHDLIVTGKRMRRHMVKVNWSASDESDTDPYKTDEESDEWEPSSEYTESQN